MSFKGYSIFSSGSHFVQRSGRILANLEEGHPRNISMKLFRNRSIRVEISFKDFLFFSSAGHFVQRSITILVEGHPRNTSVTLF